MLYKMKEENSVRGRVSRIILKESLSRSGASRKTATGHEPGQSVAEKRKVHSSKARDSSRNGGKLAKGTERGDKS